MKIITFFVLCLVMGSVYAQEVDRDSYTIQRLIVVNDKGQILLQKHPNGWMTPALRHSKPIPINKSIHELASDFGLQISQPKLRGIFMYFHSDDKTPSFRQHYAAQVIGGKLKTPAGMLNAKWFDVPSAIVHMLDKDAKIVSAVGEMTEHILNYPNIIWGGSYMLIKNKGKKTKSEVIENFYPIGKVS